MNFMLQVLQTVLLCSLVIVIVWMADLALKKRAGYRWRKILWLVLAIRLLLPFSVNLNAVVDSFHGVEIKIDMPKDFLTDIKEEARYEDIGDTKEADGWQDNINEGLDVPVSVCGSPSWQSGQTPANDSPIWTEGPVKGENGHNGKVTWFHGIIVLWAAGAVAMFGIKVFQYQKLKRKYLKKSVVCDDSRLIACMDGLCKEMEIKKAIPVRMVVQDGTLSQSPMLLGYFRTILLLPDVPYSSSESEAILRHELTHYAAKDLWYKLLLVIVCEMYWFNPIFRLMKNIAFHDVECVCDEKVTGKMNLDDRQDYSSIILKFMSRAKKEEGFIFTTQFAGTKKNAKKRFENIFSAHNRKIGMCVLTFFLTVLVAGTACVSVKVADDTEDMPKPGQVVDVPETDSLLTKKGIVISADILSENDEALLDELAEKYPDYTVTVADTGEYHANEFWEQPATVIRVGISETLELAKEGKTADITEILEKRGWLDAMNGDVRGLVSDEEGRIYGIPAVSPYAYGLVINVELFREAGLVDGEGMPLIPQTWEEVANTALKIKETTGEAGLCLIGEDYLGSLHFCNIAYNFGAPQFISREADGKVRVHLDSEEAIAAMQFIKDLKWEYDVLTENPREENYFTGYEHLANNTAAMFIGANDSLGNLTAYGMNPADIAMGAVPAGPGGEQYAIYGGGAFVFPKDVGEEEIEAVLDLLEMQGMGPVFNEAAKERTAHGVQDAVSAGIPAISEIPVWDSDERTEYEQELLAQSGNVEQKMFWPYFEKVLTSGSLRAEECLYTSTLYMELSDVLVKIMTDPDADVAALMERANENCQKIIDTE